MCKRAATYEVHTRSINLQWEKVLQSVCTTQCVEAGVSGGAHVGSTKLPNSWPLPMLCARVYSDILRLFSCSWEKISCSWEKDSCSWEEEREPRGPKGPCTTTRQKRRFPENKGTFWVTPFFTHAKTVFSGAGRVI